MIFPFFIQTPAHLTLDLAKPGVAVSPMLYGQMTEEINYSYDGGLYGELVRNRAFRNDAQRATSWTAVGDGASISLEKTGGVSAALPVSLRVTNGVANDGYWGFPIRPSTTYRFSAWIKATGRTPITAALESKDGEQIYARSEVVAAAGPWHKVATTLVTSRGIDATKDARLVVRTGGAVVRLSLVSLFAPTHKNRPNGNRPDLMQKLIDMRPKFLRFPGGNYLEGNLIKDHFPWKETLGPLEQRPGHQGTWGYRSSDGVGLLEYLLWCEDMGAKPLLAVFAGYALNKDYVRPGTELTGFVQDALDEIEYVIGDPKTTFWGAKRAENGHAAPFPLEYVEVGNEDGFDDSGSYQNRFVQFFDAIKHKYPKLNVISTTGGKDWLGLKYPITKRRPDLYDEHYYTESWDMMAQATLYDNYNRKGPKVFVGEWAAHDTIPPWQAGASAGPTPNFKCALADAAFMTGMERNSDIVAMSCYAPLLVNANPGGRQWSLNLIGYDAMSSFGSPSYYAQCMFGENLGDRTVPQMFTGVPIQTRGNKTLPGLFASCTRDNKKGTIYLKVVNALPTAQELAIEFKGGVVLAEGVVTTLSCDDLKAMNSVAEPTKVAPVKTRDSGLGASFSRTLPAQSITVFKLNGLR